MGRIRLGIVAAIMLIVCLGCSLLSSDSISITEVGWYIDNVDPSFWTGTPPGAHAFLRFYIAYSGSDISASDISSIKVTAPDLASWTPNLSSCTIDTQNQVIVPPALYGGSGVDTLPIGTYSFRVKLTNGKTATANLLVPAPNSKTTGTYTRVHTEDVGSPPAYSAALVRRATLGSHSNVAGTLTINFGVNDSKVYNGYIWLYDTANTYIGCSATRFRDSANGNILSILNGGSAYHTNGTSNTVTLSNTDITYQTGKSFSDIYKFIVVLTDGAQYVPASFASADCRSISARTVF